MSLRREAVCDADLNDRIDFEILDVLADFLLLTLDIVLKGRIVCEQAALGFKVHVRFAGKHRATNDLEAPIAVGSERVVIANPDERGRIIDLRVEVQRTDLLRRIDRSADFDGRLWPALTFD